MDRAVVGVAYVSPSPSPLFDIHPTFLSSSASSFSPSFPLPLSLFPFKRLDRDTNRAIRESLTLSSRVRFEEIYERGAIMAGSKASLLKRFPVNDIFEPFRRMEKRIS